MELIDKAAVVAEIEKRIKKYATIDVGNSSELDALYGAKCKALMEMLSFLDTLEVKEMDLDYIKKELDELIRIHKPDGGFGWGTLYNVATHFFELGLKAKGE